MKNNETFNHEDEWYCLCGPKLTIDESSCVSEMQWKIIKNKIKDARFLFEKEEIGGVFRKQANFKYVGLLWKYEELIKRMKKN